MKSKQKPFTCKPKAKPEPKFEVTNRKARRAAKSKRKDSLAS